MIDDPVSAVIIPHMAFVLLMGVSAIAGQWLALQFGDVKTHWLGPVTIVSICVLLAVVLPQTGIHFWLGIWSVPLFVGLSSVALIDLRTKTIPDIIIFPLIVLGLGHAVFQGGIILYFAAAVGAIISLGFFGSIVTRNSQGWVGGGDVLLLAAAAAWLGPSLLPDILLLTALGLILHLMIGAIVNRVNQHSDGNVGNLPLAPALNFSVAVIWLGGPLF